VCVSMCLGVSHAAPSPHRLRARCSRQVGVACVSRSAFPTAEGQRSFSLQSLHWCVARTLACRRPHAPNMLALRPQQPPLLVLLLLCWTRSEVWTHDSLWQFSASSSRDGISVLTGSAHWQRVNNYYHFLITKGKSYAFLREAFYR
jgi:hypothetical protein